MFESYPTYDKYRALRLTPSVMRGEDVFALQTALNYSNSALPDLETDGLLGEKTAQAIETAQTALRLAVDGVVGPKTWVAVVDGLARIERKAAGVAVGLLYGQIAHESSFRGGIYSGLRLDGSYDAGVAQRNTRFTAPADAYNVPESLHALAVHARDFFEKYAGVEDPARRWGLAAGAWNAPAYANWIADQEGATIPGGDKESPSANARVALEAYIQSVTAYLRLPA